MCLLIFAHRVDPRHPLVLAANRDEFHARPTAASAFWPEYPQLLAGRDMAGGGTWMGVTRGGRFAAVTNYRDPARTAPAPRSRGVLPLDYLVGNQSPRNYLEAVLPLAQEYAGFNLLVGDSSELWYLTNIGAPQARAPLCLEPGIYGLSNASLDTPWPKVTLGKERLAALLRQDELDHASLAAVVGDRRLADPQALNRHGLNSGMDQILSAQFITTASYGTRSSTTLWIDHKGLTHWRESSFDAGGQPVSQYEESFFLEAHSR
jgi:uncharacterized protein with NRDE domain